MLTVVDRIEAVLISPPLFPLSNNPNDLAALTPAHFLVGGPLLSLPNEASDDERAISPTARYKLLKRINEKIWISWKRDYLTEMQIHKRWVKNGPELVVGDLVLLAEDNEAPLQWKLARIVET